MSISHRIKVVLSVCLLLSLFLVSRGSSAQNPKSENPFMAVFVDDATEKQLGPFPYDRSEYAKALKALHQAGAKAVVIKFFLDQPKPGPGDDVLADEMKEIPVLLQARLDVKESNPNPLPKAFDCSAQVEGDPTSLLSAESGWIPLEKFSRNCAGIGVAYIAYQGNTLRVPMVQRYQKSVLPALELASVEMALGQKARIRLGTNLALPGHSLPLDPAGRVALRLPAKDDLKALSFVDLVTGKFDPESVRGKIAVLGFDASETPTAPTSLGPLRIHRLFFYSLESLYQQLVAH